MKQKAMILEKLGPQGWGVLLAGSLFPGQRSKGLPLMKQGQGTDQSSAPPPPATQLARCSHYYTCLLGQGAVREGRAHSHTAGHTAGLKSENQDSNPESLLNSHLHRPAAPEMDAPARAGGQAGRRPGLGVEGVLAEELGYTGGTQAAGGVGKPPAELLRRRERPL